MKLQLRSQRLEKREEIFPRLRLSDDAAKCFLTHGGFGEHRSHVNGSGFVVVVAAVQGNLVVRFVVEKSPKRELKEAVMERLAVDEVVAKRIVSVAGAVVELLGIDGIEVRCVSWVNDSRLVRRLLAAQLL